MDNIIPSDRPHHNDDVSEGPSASQHLNIVKAGVEAASGSELGYLCNNLAPWATGNSYW